MTSKIENTECLCVFVATLGPLKETFETLIDSIVATLTTIKTILALIPTNLSDLLEKEALQATVTILEAALGPLSAPATVLDPYTRAFADCPPLATWGKVSDVIRQYTGVTALEELIFEIDKKIDEIERQNLAIEDLDNLIAVLQEIKEAINACGETA